MVIGVWWPAPSSLTRLSGGHLPPLRSRALASVALGVGAGLLSLRIYYDVATWLRSPTARAHAFVPRGKLALLQQTQAFSTRCFRPWQTGVAGRSPCTALCSAHPGARHCCSNGSAIAGAAVMWRSGERTAAIKVGLLILADWGVDATFSVRNLQLAYAVTPIPC